MNAQSNGFKTILPSAFKCAPYKPCCSAIVLPSATKSPGKMKAGDPV